MVLRVESGGYKVRVLESFVDSQQFLLLKVVNLNQIVGLVSNYQESCGLSRESKTKNLEFRLGMNSGFDLRAWISVDDDLRIESILCRCYETFLFIGCTSGKSMALGLKVLFSAI